MEERGLLRDVSSCVRYDDAAMKEIRTSSIKGLPPFLCVERGEGIALDSVSSTVEKLSVRRSEGRGGGPLMPPPSTTDRTSEAG
jgi:hypothetical protein